MKPTLPVMVTEVGVNIVREIIKGNPKNLPDTTIEFIHCNPAGSLRSYNVTSS